MTIKNKVSGLKKDFDMNSATSCVFHHSQWEDCVDGEHASIFYFIYRLLFMMILISSITFSTLCQSYLFEIFLTNWSFTLQTLYGTLFCFNIIWKKHPFLLHSFRVKFSSSYQETTGKNYELNEAKMHYDNMTNIIIDEDKDKVPNTLNGVVCESQQTIMTTDSAVKTDTGLISNKNADAPSSFEKLIWILMNVTHVLPHVVAFGYWVFVYKYDPDQKSCERFRSHYIVHGATSILALVDSLVVAVPARKTHFIFPSFVLLVYTIFSYIYEVAGGKYRNGNEFIYSILNWRYKASKTVLMVIVGIILSPLVHTITCWLVHHVRLKLVTFHKRNRK